MPTHLKRSLEEISCEVYNSDPTRVRRVAKVMPSEETSDEAARQLKAVADPVRLRILYALSKEPLCVCELSVLLNMSMPAVSHHLRILLSAGLLKVRKEGKFACYHLRDSHFARTMLQPILRSLSQKEEA
ncbi:transcriptional regulator, ArsR family [Chthonomonas calidirosea]|uniref:Transcriptional regulator, ArsR family n=1 Tax=Chthonomonas calidirosea (strain DSM 23976 / ICMP 18418 / T49) TaxID=1303518 RepID=S0EUN1_CHTCT|nr:metalloregulator ArsR/SmtB family transcription factor [Chthonomonas calidirosea]CCW35068.1 transcriptional regulator, ArsR family [Chthonomonas calidirosea T49]CEK20916.1 transcriptional regulator, ArsR family [Chthonomonas calidirosea]